MTPAEALSLLRKGDPKGIVPALYRKMHGDLLRALVDEIGRGRATSPDAPPDDPQETEPQPSGPVSGSVQALLQRAIARPERLRTPARRRVAFLRHYAACRTLVEAAARTGIDRRTVNRWRTASRAFNQRLRRLATDRREDAFEQAMLVASRPRMRPIFYRGKKVGEYEIPNTGLALYLLKQADIEAQRAASRRRAKAEAVPKEKSFGDALEEALRRADEMRLRATQEDPERRRGEMSSSAEKEMSRSPGHSGLPAEEQAAMAWRTEARRQHWAEIERRSPDSTESAQSEE